MEKRVIFHIDVNSAFLSWEAVYRLKHLGGELDLRMIPSAVGGDISKRHGIILAKSIPAKKYHIQTGEPVTDALKKCPDLCLVPPNYSLYEKNSRAMMEILRDYSPSVEIFSIDEAFIDMTGMESLFGPPVQAAARIKDRIREELGFTVNVGVSSNKLLAKMASDFKKPDLVHTLFPEEIEKKMWGLPVRDLFFVGAATEKKLRNLGIHTVGELARTDPEILRSCLKKQGEVSHQKKLEEPTDVTNEIYEEACQIFLDMWRGKSIRHMGIHTGEVSEQNGCRQLSLFDDQRADHEKLSRMDRAIDAIRMRYGADSVKRAVFLENDKIDHLSGGISREKRTVDYSLQEIR